MGAESRDVRNAQATKLLDWGFANYTAYHADGGSLQDIRVTGGVKNHCSVGYDSFSIVLPKGDATRVEQKITLDEQAAAPLSNGDEVGRVEYLLNGQVLGQIPITVREDIEKIDFWGLWQRLIAKILLM
jgi:D-alanyl-D-alanine carboxypeptidase (penicillin-binding protein 5/6)